MKCFFRLPDCSIGTTRRCRGFLRKQAEYSQHNDTAPDWREEISRSVVAGHSIRSVAARLGRAPSTISREVRRNGGGQGYRANQTDQLAWERARRPKTCKAVRNQTLAQVVASKLQLQWSPEQIAGWLKHAYAVNKDYQVSHETISRSLYIQARGALIETCINADITTTLPASSTRRSCWRVAVRCAADCGRSF